MTYLDTWRSQLKHHVTEFAPLAREDRHIHLVYGLTAAAVLWSVREAPFNDEQKNALKIACGDEKHLPHLLKAMGGWDEMLPIEAVRSLSKRQGQNNQLQAALTAVLGYFIENLYAEKMIQQQSISITGNVSGGNVNIGGSQVIIGDLIIQQIRQNVVSRPVAPNPPIYFTGRERELDELKNELLNKDIVAVTAVRAIGGMGKTTLAKAFCHQPDSPFNVVLWAEMGENPNIMNILHEWARYAVDDHKLGSGASEEETIGWVRAQLSKLALDGKQFGGKWLIVFDDVWDTEESYHAVEKLQDALPPNTKFLITTRQIDTVNYFHAHSIELFELSNGETLSLLQKLRSNENPYLTDEHLERVASLIKGHPLTLELAMGSLNDAEDPEDIEEILNAYERGIQDGSPFDALNFGVETPRMLNVVFGRSYQMLSETDQYRFRTLGVLTLEVSWDRSLLGELWQIPIEQDLTNALKTLRLRAMIKQDPEASEKYSGVWYQQHPLLHAYARALLRQNTAEYENVSLFYIKQILSQLIYQCDLPAEEFQESEELYFPHIEEGSELLKTWCGQPTVYKNWKQLSVQYTIAAMQYLKQAKVMPDRGYLVLMRVRRGIVHLIVMLNEIGVKNASELKDYRNAIKLLEYVSYFPFAFKYHDEVISKFERIVDFSDLGGEFEVGANACQEMANNYLSVFINKKTKYEKNASTDDAFSEIVIESEYAAWLLEKAADLWGKAGNKAEQARALSWIGFIHFTNQEFDQAYQLYQNALDLLRQVKEKSGEADVLFSIGNIHYNGKDKLDAIPFYEQALEIRRELQDSNGEEATLEMITKVYMETGNSKSALPYCERSLELSTLLEDKDKQSETLYSMARIYSTNGEKAKALSLYLRQLELYQESGKEDDSVIGTMYNIAGVYLALRDFDNSLKYYEMALELAIRINSRKEEASVRFAMGLLYKHQKALGLAIQFMSEAVSIEEETQHPDLEEDRATLIETTEEATRATQIDIPEETLEELMGMVFFATTEIEPPERHEAIKIVFNLRQQAKNCQDVIGIDFFDSLIEILEDKPVTLSSDNPYYPHVQSLLQIIANPKLLGEEEPASVDDDELFLPFQKIEEFIRNTFLAKTAMPEKLVEWQQTIGEWKLGLEEMEDDMEVEIEFLDALLAIVNDQHVCIAENNPYAPYVDELLIALDNLQDDIEKGSRT